MKTLKPAVTLAGAITASALGGTALANHQGWENWPPRESVSPRYVVVPQQPAVVGYVAAPTYYYERAPRYYYYEPAPTYYYEPAPVVSYHYNYDSAFPHSNSRD